MIKKTSTDYVIGHWGKTFFKVTFEYFPEFLLKTLYLDLVWECLPPKKGHADERNDIKLMSGKIMPQNEL